MNWMFLILFLFTKVIAAEPACLISEVLMNPLNPKSEKKGEWIEIYRPSNSAIRIQSLEIIRYDSKWKKELFHVKTEPENLILPGQSFLVLGQSEDLGLGQCLKCPVLMIDDPAFTFPNRGAQLLCIKLNQEEPCCAHIFLESKTPTKGRALYPSSFARKQEDLEAEWLLETCELQKGLFATPGLAAGICHEMSDFSDEVFASCYLPKDPTLEMVSKDGPFGEEPDLTNGTYEWLDEDTLQFYFELSHHSAANLFDITFCDLSGDRTLRCNLVGDKIPAYPGSQWLKQTISKTHSEEDLSFALWVEDLYGHRKLFPLQALNQKPNSKEKKSQFSLLPSLTDGRLSVVAEIFLPSHELYNYSLYVKEKGGVRPMAAGVVLGQRKPLQIQWLEMPAKTLEKDAQVVLQFASPNYNLSTQKNLFI